jgi:Protein of unknown function (DUF1326)/Carboxypeptidase regulatory-like domain
VGRGAGRNSVRRHKRSGLVLISMGLILNVTSTFGQGSGQSGHWNVRGEAIVTCPCRVPCPCRSNAPPSQGHCENLSYVRVVEGHYGQTKLDGLHYVWAADECVNPTQEHKPTRLYFSTSATAGQIKAVESIMTGEHCAGTRQAAIRTADMVATKVDLTAGANGSVYSIRAARLAEIDIDIMPGPIPMEPLPALDLWGNTVSYSRNITAKMDDPQAGLKWDYSGLQSNYRTFESSSELAIRGLLLGIFRDDTGKFNEMQRSLIHELHLEIPLARDEFRQMLDQVRLPARQVPAHLSFAGQGSIGGIVLDPKGEPRSGARLQIQSGSSNFPQLAVTNPAGRYFFAHVPAGKYELCASTWDGKNSMRSCQQTAVSAGRVLNVDLRLAVLQAKETR